MRNETGKWDLRDLAAGVNYEQLKQSAIDSARPDDGEKDKNVRGDEPDKIRRSVLLGLGNSLLVLGAIDVTRRSYFLQNLWKEQNDKKALANKEEKKILVERKILKLENGKNGYQQVGFIDSEENGEAKKTIECEIKIFPNADQVKTNGQDHATPRVDSKLEGELITMLAESTIISGVALVQSNILSKD